MKICTGCFIEKTFDNFGKDKHQKDGLKYKCKTCRSLYSKTMQNKNSIYYVNCYEENYADINFRNATNRAKRMHRVPNWLTIGDIVEMKWAYQLAKEITTNTGIKYVVDHIIPLNGHNISGLHCPQNLRIITAFENRQKKNKFPYETKTHERT